MASETERMEKAVMAPGNVTHSFAASIEDAFNRRSCNSSCRAVILLLLDLRYVESPTIHEQGGLSWTIKQEQVVFSFSKEGCGHAGTTAAADATHACAYEQAWQAVEASNMSATGAAGRIDGQAGCLANKGGWPVGRLSRSPYLRSSAAAVLSMC